MPFKTRRQKMAASKHRISLSEKGFISYSRTKVGNERPEERVVSYRTVTQSALSGELEMTKVKGEIIKIASLAALVIGFQLALKFSSIPIFK